jgi:hypothetical protein
LRSATIKPKLIVANPAYEQKLRAERLARVGRIARKLGWEGDMGGPLATAIPGEGVGLLEKRVGMHPA